MVPGQDLGVGAAAGHGSQEDVEQEQEEEPEEGGQLLVRHRRGGSLPQQGNGREGAEGGAAGEREFFKTEKVHCFFFLFYVFII